MGHQPRAQACMAGAQAMVALPSMLFVQVAASLAQPLLMSVLNDSPANPHPSQDHLLDQMLALLPRGGDRQEAKPKRGPRHASWRWARILHR